MKVDSFIKKNREKSYEKPNEDFLICDPERNVFIVADGVTREHDKGVYPYPSPASEVSKIFAEYIHTNWSDNISTFDDFKEKITRDFLAANALVKDYNEKAGEHIDGFEAAGTVVLVGTIFRQKLYISYIGDCSCAIIRKGLFEKITQPQTKLVVAHRGEFSRFEVRNYICNNPDHKYGFGVFNGDLKVSNFLAFVEYELQQGDTILFYSDGCDPIMTQEYVSFINSASTKEIIRNIEAIELSKGIRSDDKGLIKIKIDE